MHELEMNILSVCFMNSRGRALILVALGYFVAASHCLFSQTPAAAAAPNISRP